MVCASFRPAVLLALEAVLASFLACPKWATCVRPGQENRSGTAAESNQRAAGCLCANLSACQISDQTPPRTLRAQPFGLAQTGPKRCRSKARSSMVHGDIVVR